MDKKKVMILSAFLLAAVLIGFWGFRTANVVKDSNNYDNFAKCVTESGAKMYGAFWCSHCNNQKKGFSSSWQYIEYVECSTPDGQGQTGECRAAGIKGYPTWEFSDGSRQEGEVPFETLSELTSCKLP